MASVAAAPAQRCKAWGRRAPVSSGASGLSPGRGCPATGPRTPWACISDGLLGEVAPTCGGTRRVLCDPTGGSLEAHAQSPDFSPRPFPLWGFVPFLPSPSESWGGPGTPMLSPSAHLGPPLCFCHAIWQRAGCKSRKVTGTLRGQSAVGSSMAQLGKSAD